MYDRKNMKVIDGSVIIKIVTILLLLMTLLLLSSYEVFAVDRDTNAAKFYTDYTIVEYKVNLAQKKGKTYTLTDAYTLGDVLCIRFFQTQYPFAAASFNLLSIGNK